MFSFSLRITLYLFLTTIASSTQDLNFTYNGFRQTHLNLDGIAEVTRNGLLMLTNHTSQKAAHAFYPNPIKFKNASSNGTVFSFSTTFVFAIVPQQYRTFGGHGIAFVISPTKGLPGALPSQYLGLFNKSNNGNDSNRVFAVELDTIFSSEFLDINDNHVGIDINGLQSLNSTPAGYFAVDNKGVHQFKNLSLVSGQPMQLWVDYDGTRNRIDVTLAPMTLQHKPQITLMSFHYDLSQVLYENMYVGFSSSTGSVLTNHYVLGWSFKINGEAPNLDLSMLPNLPRIGPKKKPKLLTIGVPSICFVLLSITVLVVVLTIRRRRKFAEVVEDWELEYGPQRFKYKDLYFATKGFKEKDLLGIGGFGRVYKGTLSTSKVEIAVKKVSHESRQGMKEFVAEIVSIGRLRHRNIVSLLGYCRRKGELLLVYDYMPNGSLDKYLHNPQPNVTLSWQQRFHVIKNIASGLFYLHEGWEQVVIHRDIKASNVLLDGDMNGRLGDFGLARLYERGSDPQTTHVVGTVGYVAPEHTRTGKATSSTDVFAFGAFMLEVVCGRRPIETQGMDDDEIFLLVEWVFSCWLKGDIVEAKDPKLEIDYDTDEEVSMVLSLGLLCSNSDSKGRPNMRQVVQFLEKDIVLPDLSTLNLNSHGLSFADNEGFDDFVPKYSTTTSRASQISRSSF